MPSYAALDVSQETTAICVVDETGRILAEKKVATCPDAITNYLTQRAPDLVRVGLETGAAGRVALEQLAARRLPVLCIDARHANAALKMRPVKTDRNDAAWPGADHADRLVFRKCASRAATATSSLPSGAARCWCGSASRSRTRSEASCAPSAFCSASVSEGSPDGPMRSLPANIDASPEMRLIAETLMKARASMLDQIKVLDRRLMAVA